MLVREEIVPTTNETHPYWEPTRIVGIGLTGLAGGRSTTKETRGLETTINSTPGPTPEGGAESGRVIAIGKRRSRSGWGGWRWCRTYTQRPREHRSTTSNKHTGKIIASLWEGDSISDSGSMIDGEGRDGTSTKEGSKKSRDHHACSLHYTIDRPTKYR